MKKDGDCMADTRYIQIRQIIFFYLLLCITVRYTIVRIQDNYFVCLFSFFTVLLCVFFVPSMKRELNYSEFLHTMMYYFSMYIWGGDCLFNANNYGFRLCLPIRIFAIVGIVLIILLRKNDYKNVLMGSISKIPIQRKEFVNELTASGIALVSEELYFTAFLIGRLHTKGIVCSVFTSAILFALSHFLNRWASKMFSLKDYLFILVLAIFKGIVFYYTRDIMLTIIIHFIYNSSEFIVLVKRLRLKNSGLNNVSMFDDYE